MADEGWRRRPIFGDRCATIRVLHYNSPYWDRWMFVRSGVGDLLCKYCRWEHWLWIYTDGRIASRWIVDPISGWFERDLDVCYCRYHDTAGHFIANGEHVFCLGSQLDSDEPDDTSGTVFTDHNVGTVDRVYGLYFPTCCIVVGDEEENALELDVHPSWILCARAFYHLQPCIRKWVQLIRQRPWAPLLSNVISLPRLRCCSTYFQHHLSTNTSGINAWVAPFIECRPFIVTRAFTREAMMQHDPEYVETVCYLPLGTLVWRSRRPLSISIGWTWARYVRYPDGLLDDTGVWIHPGILPRDPARIGGCASTAIAIVH